MNERKNVITWRLNPTHDSWLFEAEPLQVTSVGVLVHTGEISPGRYPGRKYTAFLLAEVIGAVGKPWGIPAGRVEPNEFDPRQTGLRELREETGLAVDSGELRPFTISGDNVNINESRVVYSCRVSEREILQLGEWRFESGIYLIDRKVESTEIGRLALVPSDQMYRRSHPILSDYYRWDVMHDIKAKLEGLRVI